MGRASCSHYLPLCSPTERHARQHRFLLTLAANDQNRLKSHENVCWGCVWRCYPPPAFSKAADWLVFRYAAIQNSFENGQEAKSPLSARRRLDRQKPWFLGNGECPKCIATLATGFDPKQSPRRMALCDDGLAASGLQHTLGGRRGTREHGRRTDWPLDKIAPAIWTKPQQHRLCAVGAKCAFEATNASAQTLRGEIAITALTIWT